MLVVSALAMTGKSEQPRRRSYGLVEGEQVAWSVMATLIAGPVLYGVVGWGIDALVGTSRVFLALGVVVGFVLSTYIVYARYGRG
jgi:F0F1-type ATP synthase assembly protein I